MKGTKYTVLLILVLAAVLVAGCQQQSPSEGTAETPAPTATPEPTQTIKPEPTDTPVTPKEQKLLNDEEYDKAYDIYFERCAGCHGTLRGGATGPELTPEKTESMGTESLETIISKGLPGGMPSWSDTLSEDEIELMAKYIQMEPPEPPFNSIADIKESSWADSPDELVDEPTHDHNVDDLLVVTLRDTGQNAVIDQSTKEVVKILDTGYATHVTKFSTDGRFAIIMGRDGLVSKLDLYSLEIVGEAKIGIDARDVAVSKYEGYEDEYIVAGAYWPPQAVILDFDTMEPEKIVNLQGVDTDGEYQKEVRGAAMYASSESPTFIVNAKESGQVWLVDYTDLRNLRTDVIAAEKFLHDGFFDQTGRYFMVAANQRNKMEIIDTKEREWVAEIETGQVPHPGPGAVWETEEYGYVAATTHLGEGKVTIWGTDPAHEEHLWQIIEEVDYDAESGGLFINTHENSPYVWFDSPLSTGEGEGQQMYVMDKETFEVVKTIQPTSAEGTLALHTEFNKEGTEAWVSVWDTKGTDSTDNAIVVYDTETLEEKARMANDEWPGLISPTGKFQTYLRANE